MHQLFITPDRLIFYIYGSEIERWHEMTVHDSVGTYQTVLNESH